MGKSTGIQWADTTINPSTGCDGCELWHPRDKGPCYAGNLHEGRLAKSLPGLYAADFTEVRTAPGRMAKAAALSDLRGKPRPDKPWLDGQPRIIFVGDMGDIFSDNVLFEYLRDEILAAATTPAGARHFWLWLTKRPARAANFGRWLADQGIPWPRNIGCGTSVTSDKHLARLDQLLAVPAPLKFASLEPLRSAVSVARWLDPVHTDEAGIDNPDPHPDPWGALVMPMADPWITGLGWLIVGGESPQGRYTPSPFDIRWLDPLADECRSVHVPLFVKQYGGDPFETTRLNSGEPARLSYAGRDKHGADWSEWMVCHRIREVPAFGRIMDSRDADL